MLDLIESELIEDEVDRNSCFPQNGTCLESLIFDCVDSPINFEALERLAVKSPSLKKLRLNRHVTIVQLYRLMVRAPQLTHLGTSSFGPGEIVAQGEQVPDYVSAFAACKSLVCLSGFREINAHYLPTIVPVCANLTSLNLSYATISTEQLKSFIYHCHKLQTLWVSKWNFRLNVDSVNLLVFLTLDLCRCLTRYAMKDCRQWLQHVKISMSQCRCHLGEIKFPKLKFGRARIRSISRSRIPRLRKILLSSHSWNAKTPLRNTSPKSPLL